VPQGMEAQVQEAGFETTAQFEKLSNFFVRHYVVP
jgi:hypothetical protein